MATFYSVLSFMAVNGFEYSEPGSFDIISRLPLEMAITIMRMLSGKDLLNAACVNKKWFHICKSDYKLRQKIKRYLRQQRRAWITTRMLGMSGRNGPSHVSNRPAMMNVVNTTNNTNFQSNRLTVGASTSRYMPYRWEAPIGTSRRNSTKSRRNVGENISAYSRIRL